MRQLFGNVIKDAALELRWHILVRDKTACKAEGVAKNDDVVPAGPYMAVKGYLYAVNSLAK